MSTIFQTIYESSTILRTKRRGWKSPLDNNDLLRTVEFSLGARITRRCSNDRSPNSHLPVRMIRPDGEFTTKYGDARAYVPLINTATTHKTASTKSPTRSRLSTRERKERRTGNENERNGQKSRESRGRDIEFTFERIKLSGYVQFLRKLHIVLNNLNKQRKERRRTSFDARWT